MHLVSNKCSESSNYPKSSRSRNVEKIHEINNSCQNNTQRPHKQLEKNNLLKMFTTFLSNDSRDFKNRKTSIKNELKTSLVSCTLKNQTKNKTMSHKSQCSGEKCDKSQHDSFNIFKSKESNNDKLNSQTNNKDIFNLNEIKDDLLDFSIQSIDKSNIEVNKNNERCHSTDFDCKSKHIAHSDIEETKPTQLPITSSPQFNNYL